MITVAALYVAKGGCYYGLPDVDPWDAERDARLYAGPHPVVAHPPCSRWCRLAGLVMSVLAARGGMDLAWLVRATIDMALAEGIPQCIALPDEQDPRLPSTMDAVAVRRRESP